MLNLKQNARTNVGLFELSPFSKFDLKGEKAHEELQVMYSQYSKQPEKINIHKC